MEIKRHQYRICNAAAPQWTTRYAVYNWGGPNLLWELMSRVAN